MRISREEFERNLREIRTRMVLRKHLYAADPDDWDSLLKAFTKAFAELIREWLAEQPCKNGICTRENHDLHRPALTGSDPQQSTGETDGR